VTMWDSLQYWINNPILVKHIRSRLRLQPLLTSLAVVVMLNLCLAYAGYELNWYKTGTVAGCIVAMQVVLLVVMGAAQVNASVNGARASGILDFHRVSPLTATELTLGFFFGAPIREYVLVAATLPFTVLCMAFGIPSFRGFLQLMIIVLTSSWLIHGVMLLNGLISKAKNPSGGMVGVIVFLVFFLSSIVMGAQYSVNVVEGDHRLNFFGISLPWLPAVLLYQLPTLFFLLLAGTRKMESQRMHPLSKPQAIIAMCTFAVLVVGGIWKQESYEIFQVASLYLLSVPAILLTMMITPTQAEYAKSLYRAQKLGRTRLPWWDDLSVNWITLVILAAIVLTAGTVAGTMAVGTIDPLAGRQPTGPYSLALAAAVLTVAYHGLALQFFQLRFGKRGVMYFALFLFVVWGLPLLAGSIHSMAAGPMSSSEAGYPIFALSPVAGIAMIFTVGQEPMAYSVQASTLTPILLFTFVFNYLVVTARRRVMKSVFAATADRTRDEGELVLAEPVAESL
jgi:hypothetical protein